MIDPERAYRLRVLWDKGRNFYQSFFAELRVVHSEADNETEFINWCWNNLKVSVGVISELTGVLQKVDARIERENLARAREIEKTEKKVKAEADRQQRMEQRAAREAESARKEAEKKEREKRAKNKEKCRRQRQRKKEQEVAKYAAALADTENEKSENLRYGHVTKTAILPDDVDRAAAIKSALVRVKSGRDEWIEGSIELGALLRQERMMHSSNNDFGSWLARHDININSHDRAALIDMASDLEAMRKTLAATDRSSFRHIWGDIKKQIAAA